MKIWLSLFLLACLSIYLVAQDEHDHPAPEKLGKVSFPTSCAPDVQPKFERAVALLHSFAYSVAEKGFQAVLQEDPQCAMARWGVAMTYYHQLWDTPTAATLAKGKTELEAAMKSQHISPRERGYIEALQVFYKDSDKLPHSARANAYEQKMEDFSTDNPEDNEAQIFYALALLGTASMFDKTHAHQKQAARILEPLYARYPDHPGLAHYLIHSYDSSELAQKGVTAARAYAKIAPSAPHALHMPSHIFTRLGMWDDSIASNKAARAAAHSQGDVGEELHAMDYLVYAYLQRGRDAEAAKVIDDLKSMSELRAGDFKIGYAATAMPVRYVVERKQWADAAKLEALPGAPPHVAAITHWARTLGLSRSGRPGQIPAEIEQLKKFEAELAAAKNDYWASVVHVLTLEAQGWLAEAQSDPEKAASLLRQAADQEDAVEKLPVTPGPIVPAREQLAEVLLLHRKPSMALKEFDVALQSAPGRRAALEGAAKCADLLGDSERARQYRAGF